MTLAHLHDTLLAWGQGAAVAGVLTVLVRVWIDGREKSSPRGFDSRGPSA